MPAPDGFQNPVQSPGFNSKICNPTNQLLDRSASAPASLCSPGPSLPAPADAGAGEPAASAPRCQATPGGQQQHLPTLAGKDPSPQPGELTCGSPACLSQQTLKEAGLADSQRECDAEGQGPAQEHPLEEAEGSSLAAAAAKHERSKDGCLSLEQKNELPIGHQVSKDPEKEQLEKQTETTHPEAPCHVEKPGVGAGSQPEDPPVERRGDGQEEAGLSPAEGSIQVSASCSCLQTEAFMEVDVVEQSVAEEHISASEQRQQVENRSAAELGLEPFSMEVELLKSVSSSSGTPAKCTELSALAAEDSSCPSSICQLDTDPGRPAEEPCSSLASALKELHKLLVISRKAECKVLASEEVSQLEVVHREPAAQQEGLSEGEQKGSAPAIQKQSCSFCEVRAEGGRAEGKQLCAAGRENASSGPVGRVQSAPGGAASEVLRCSAESDLVVVSSAAASDQQQSSEQSEVLAEGSQSPTNSTCQRNTSACSAPAPGEGAAPGTQSPSTGAPCRSSSAASEGTGPSGGREEPLLSPVGSSAGLGSAAGPPPAFPAAAMGRLLGAGFTAREALEALERADGNADLALLILLAKGIVVPT